MASAQVVTRMRRLSSGFGRCFLGASWLGQAQAAVEETTQTVVDSSRKRMLSSSSSPTMLSWLDSGVRRPLGGRTFATGKGNMADDLITYARQCQSRSAALETIEHGAQMLERDSQGLEVEGLVRLGLVSAELCYIDSKTSEVERHCNAALALASENDELLNAKFQSECSLFARHLLTLVYLREGKDNLASDLTSAYADVDVSSSAYDFQSSIIGKKTKKVMAGVYEGMKGLLDHSLGIKELSEENWDKVAKTLGPDIRSWEKEIQLNHVMKNYAMYMHCIGKAGLSEFDYVSQKAEDDSNSREDSVELWGSALILKEVAFSARYAAAQALIKEKKFEDAEQKLESLLEDYGKTFRDDDSRMGLIILKLGEVYAETNRWVALKKRTLRFSFSIDSSERDDRRGKSKQLTYSFFKLFAFPQVALGRRFVSQRSQASMQLFLCYR